MHKCTFRLSRANKKQTTKKYTKFVSDRIYTYRRVVCVLHFILGVTLNASLWLLALVTDINIGAILCYRKFEGKKKRPKKKNVLLLFVFIFIIVVFYHRRMHSLCCKMLKRMME